MRSSNPRIGHRRLQGDRQLAHERARKAAADALHELYANRSEAAADDIVRAILDDITAEQNAHLEGDDVPDET
jgi:hypothetical protein